MPGSPAIASGTSRSARSCSSSRNGGCRRAGLSGLRRGLRSAGLALLGVALCGCDRAAGPATKDARIRPNIILILADDQAPRTLGYEGNPHARTPNIDRLAREGTHFTRAYVPLPQCAPSRAALLTGRYPSETGVLSNNYAEVDERQWATVSRTLKNAGYECAMVGKWHLGDFRAPHAGFDAYWAALDTDAPIERHYHDPAIYVGGERWLEPGYATDILTDHALGFVERSAAGRAEPFFLWLNFKSPHAPYETSPDPRFKFDPASLPLPASVTDDLSTKPAPQRTCTARRNFEATTLDALRNDLALYYSMIASIDANVGRLRDAVERTGLSPRTLIIYMSDNGVLLGEHQMIEKDCNFYEEQVRSPLVFWWPDRVPAGQRRDALVSSLDLFPTLARLGGADPPADLRGADLWPLVVSAHAPAPHAALFFEYFEKGGTREKQPVLGCVTSAFKYTWYSTGEEELYDLGQDPFEMRNLAGAAESAGLLAQHRELLAGHKARIERPFWR